TCRCKYYLEFSSVLRYIGRKIPIHNQCRQEISSPFRKGGLRRLSCSHTDTLPCLEFSPRCRTSCPTYITCSLHLVPMLCVGTYNGRSASSHTLISVITAKPKQILYQNITYHRSGN